MTTASITRTVRFRAGTYKLVPSVSAVKRSDTTCVPETVACSVIRNGQAATKMDAVSMRAYGLVLKYINGGAETVINADTDVSPASNVDNISFLLYNSDGVQIDKSTVAVVDDGPQGKIGIPGQSIRQSEWQAGITFHNDGENVSGLRYLDIVHVRLSSGNILRYVCKTTHSATVANKPTGTTSSNSYWEYVSGDYPLYIPVLMSETGEIKFFQSNRILIMKENGTVTAGLSGAGEGATGIRFWAGGANPASAPYRVNEAGKLFATDAEISGKIVATSGKVGGFTIEKGSLWWKGRDYFGDDSRSVRIGVPADENSGMVDISFNAATVGKFGIKVIGSNLGGACIYASRYSNEKDRTYPNYRSTYAGYYDGSVYVRETISSNLCIADGFGVIVSRNSDGSFDHYTGVDYDFGSNMKFRKGLLIQA